VVDDDAYVRTRNMADGGRLTRRLMGRMLGRLGHRVQYADNGGSAVDMIRAAADGSAPPLDIVFLDK
jgi:CheY-like chemotaxis protein